MNKYIKKIYPILLTTLIPILLYIWFYVVQNRYYSIYLQDTLFFSGNNILTSIEDSFYRTISHLNSDHLENNMKAFFTLQITLLLVFDTRNFIIHLLISLFCGIIVFIFYTDIVGFSLVVYSFISISIIYYIFVIYKYYKLDENSIITYISLFTIVLMILYLSKNLFLLDIPVAFNIETIDSIVSADNSINSVSDYYKPNSAEVHVYGFITGIVISILNILYKHIQNETAIFISKIK